MAGSNMANAFTEKEYENEQFKGLEFSQQTADSLYFLKCSFYNCLFTESTFKNCIFLDCKFIDCDLGLVKIPETRIRTIKFLRCKLTGIDWSQVKINTDLLLNCIRCDLSYSVFLEQNISGSKFKRCKIYEATFSNVDAKDCNFRYSDLNRTLFHLGNISGSDFRHAKNYIFMPARVSSAPPSGTICKKARFSMPEALNLLEAFEVIIDDI